MEEVNKFIEFCLENQEKLNIINKLFKIPYYSE